MFHRVEFQMVYQFALLITAPVGDFGVFQDLGRVPLVHVGVSPDPYELLAKLRNCADFSAFAAYFRGTRSHFPVHSVCTTTTGKDCGRCLSTRRYQVTGKPFKADFSLVSVTRDMSGLCNM